MKSLFTLAFALFSVSALAGTSMKVEGSCSGTLEDATPVSFVYYSSFDGCEDKSKAAVTFHEGIGMDLHTGTREFVGDKDVYKFTQDKEEAVRLTFADSTGNTSGTLRYTDMNGESKTVEVQCEVRDYHYGECEG